jgi:NADH-quinone oxidoreductase subunit C
MAKATNTEIIDLLGEKFGEQIFDVTEPYGLLTFSTTKDKIIDVLSFLEREWKNQF